jgi:hypothetical protein
MLQGNVESVTPSTRAFRVWGDGIDITAHTHDASGCQTYEDRY